MTGIKCVAPSTTPVFPLSASKIFKGTDRFAGWGGFARGTAPRDRDDQRHGDRGPNLFSLNRRERQIHIAEEIERCDLTGENGHA
jgi:hypothetical protein